MNVNTSIRTIVLTALLVVCIPTLSLPALAAISRSTQVAGGVATKPLHSVTKILPPALRPVFYKSLAKDAGSVYNINSNGCAILPKQVLKACFDSHGAHFTGAATSFSLHFVAFGRDEKLTPVKPVRPAIYANRASYTHGDLTAWWRVLSVGFEQGFTLAKRPGGPGELMLELAASGQTSQQNSTLAWNQFRYGGLIVTDANGKVVPATLKSEGDRILIAVNDKHAAYPLTVDPLVWLEQKVAESDGAEFDSFGYSVALSGSTALVGTPFATVNGTAYQGAVYVFTKSNGIWAQTQKLTASDGASADDFGYSVALAGSTALIGAPFVAINGNASQGAVYVFTESNGTWSQAQKLTAGDGAPDTNFGWSIAINSSTALVGAFYANVGGNSHQGAAYVFNDSGGTWSQTAKLIAGDGAANDNFGWSVALAGSTALVGAAYATVNGNTGQGAAYVFDDSGGVWSQTVKLTAGDGAANDNFGYSVALAGPTALVGAYDATVHGNSYQGAAYVFTNTGGTWDQTQKLTASDGAALDNFGVSVALSGTTALIGAYEASVGGNSYQGAAYVFTNTGGTWNQMQKLTASDGAAFDYFGNPVALSGATAVVGAADATINGNESQGAAYFYGGSDLGLAVSAPETVGQGQTYVAQTIATNNASVASPAVAATITVPAAASFVSATASQGSCSEASGVVNCDFGQINGNAGTASANVTLKATGNVGDTIENIAGVAKATPPLSASAPTTITAGGACPDGYSEYDGSLNPGEVARSPVYQTPGGEENAILTAPEGFQLYAVYQSGRFGRHVYRVPGNEVHRWGPKGFYMWLVRARDGAGAYTLCLQHP